MRVGKKFKFYSHCTTIETLNFPTTKMDTNTVLATGFVRVGFGAHVGWCAVGMSVRAGTLWWVRQFKEKLVANN
jgi:hypothetical protein